GLPRPQRRRRTDPDQPDHARADNLPQSQVPDLLDHSSYRDRWRRRARDQRLYRRRAVHRSTAGVLCSPKPVDRGSGSRQTRGITDPRNTQLFFRSHNETARRWPRTARAKRVPAGWHIARNRCHPAAQTGPTVSNSPLIPPSVSPSRLCVNPFDPMSAPCGSHEGIRKVLCFPRNLVALELHDAHGVGRLAVICQDEFADPKRTGANDSSDRKPLFARLTSALFLYVGSTASSLA